MTTLSLVLPQIGQPDTTEDVKVQNAFTAIQSVINGNLDSTNLSAATSQSAGVNASGQTVKGSANISTSQATSSASFTTLATPDQVTGIVLPASGLIAVWYQATWQESVNASGRAAIFLNSNQLKVAQAGSLLSQVAAISGSINTSVPLASSSSGLASPSSSGGYPGNVTTGQLVMATAAQNYGGGPCWIFAAAGTYTVSVQFSVVAGGTVTASNRQLWVQASSFA